MYCVAKFGTIDIHAYFLLQVQYDEVTQNVQEMEVEIKRLKESHQAELNRIEREHEDKILFLMGHMPKPEVRLGVSKLQK